MTHCTDFAREEAPGTFPVRQSTPTYYVYKGGGPVQDILIST